MPTHPRDRPLGKRQRQVLEALTRLTAAKGYPPVMRELAADLGVSKTLIMTLLLDLRDRELVTWVEGDARTIVVKKKDAA